MGSRPALTKITRGWAITILTSGSVRLLENTSSTLPAGLACGTATKMDFNTGMKQQSITLPTINVDHKYPKIHGTILLCHLLLTPFMRIF